MWGKEPSLEQLKDAISNPNSPIGMRMRAAYYLQQKHRNAVANAVDANADADAADTTTITTATSSNSSTSSASNSSTNDNDTTEDHIDPMDIQKYVIGILSNGLLNTAHGSLMRHEFAYVMGQINDERGCATLEEVLSNAHDCCMVRHEAAEALGAIGALRSRVVLETVMEQTQQTVPEVADTCKLALNLYDYKEKIAQQKQKRDQKQKQQNKRRGNTEDTKQNDEDQDDDDEFIPPPVVCSCMINPYSGIDPAPSHPEFMSKSSTELGTILCDTTVPIFDRYRAMFTLRNRGFDEDIQELCYALNNDDSSALLRHEVAFVLGQTQKVLSIPALETSLRNEEEHEMVRHESAEALGAIENDWTRVETILQEFTTHENQMIRESCLVALDAADYYSGHSTNYHTNYHLNEEEQPQLKETEQPSLSFVHQKALAHNTNTERTCS